MKRILFDTIAAGGGHVATARAMRDAVERHAPGAVRGEVRDAMAAVGLHRQDREHKFTWSLLLRVPPVIRLGQRIMDRSPRLVNALQQRTLDRFAQRLARDATVLEADLIVVNHGFLMVAYAVARHRYGLERSVVTFATEPFDANALWAERRAERVLAPSHEARAHLQRLGVPGDDIDVVGYPVPNAVLEAPPRSVARQQLRLAGGTWALLSLGGEGVAAQPRRWIDAMLDEGLQVMVIAGRNDALRATLSEHPAAGSRLLVLGYVDDMALRLAAVDVVVGKAGPASVLEAVALRKPFLVTSYAGDNERAVVRFLERSRCGRWVGRPRDFGRALHEARNVEAERPDFQRMRDDLGRHLVDLAHGRAPAAPLGLDRDPWRHREWGPS